MHTHNTHNKENTHNTQNPMNISTELALTIKESIHNAFQASKDAYAYFESGPSVNEARDQELDDKLSTLETISYQIAELSRMKECLEARVFELFDHPEDKQTSYVHGRYKVQIKSAWIYSLNKDEYAAIGSRLRAEFNPVRIKESYDLDKKIIRACEQYASTDDLELLAQIISKKTG